MNDNILHITNGGSLTSFLNELQFEGEIVTWQEMLCEGPTKVDVHSDELIEVRRAILGDTH